MSDEQSRKEADLFKRVRSLEWEVAGMREQVKQEREERDRLYKKLDQINDDISTGINAIHNDLVLIRDEQTRVRTGYKLIGWTVLGVIAVVSAVSGYVVKAGMVPVAAIRRRKHGRDSHDS